MTRSNSKISRVLVTGGAGYIGSQTCKELSIIGCETLVYDNLSTGFRENVKWSELVVADLLDRDSLTKTLNYFKPDGVIHFAASAYVGESVVNPIKYFMNNVTGTTNLIESMLATGTNRLVFSSSCATYGISSVGRIGEKHDQKPINPYGQSKLMAEEIIKRVSSVNNLDFVAFRYFNAAGADFDGELSEKHNPETHLIPLVIKSATSDYVLNVFGSDYETLDGTAVRDYVHVQDLASAHILGLKKINNEARNQFFNLGTEHGASVMEVIDTVKSFGLSPKYKIAERRDGDPPTLIADASKAKSLLGWEAKNSQLDAIVASILSSMK